MKRILMLTLLGVLVSAQSYANGGREGTDLRRGTAAVDEVYLDEPVDADYEKLNNSKNKMRENPRNSGMAGSFGQVDSKKDEQQRQEEKTNERPTGENNPYPGWRLDNGQD
jgi:hypothetical protein